MKNQIELRIAEQRLETSEKMLNMFKNKFAIKNADFSEERKTEILQEWTISVSSHKLEVEKLSNLKITIRIY